jgi:hypothetical protein
MDPGQNSEISVRRISRTLWAVSGLSVVFWIGYEDHSIFIPVLIGGLIATALSLRFWSRALLVSKGWRHSQTGANLLLGLLAGALVMPLAAVSMLVKVSLHGHVPPDFSAAQVLMVLGRTPIWVGAGALVGLAAERFIRLRGE